MKIDFSTIRGKNVFPRNHILLGDSSYFAAKRYKNKCLHKLRCCFDSALALFCFFSKLGDEEEKY